MRALGTAAAGHLMKIRKKHRMAPSFTPFVLHASIRGERKLILEKA